MGIHDDQANPEQWRVSHLTPRYGIIKEIYQANNVWSLKREDCHVQIQTVY